MENEFVSEVERYDIAELIARFNNEAGKGGWVAARGRFMSAMTDALLATGFDCSDFIKGSSTSWKYPIKHVAGRRIVQIKRGPKSVCRQRGIPFVKITADMTEDDIQALADKMFDASMADQERKNEGAHNGITE